MLLQQSPLFTQAVLDARQVQLPLLQRPKQQGVDPLQELPREAQPNGRHTPLSQLPLQHC